MHLVTFSVLTMAEQERWYSITEREALSILFQFKKFRVYLLFEKPFFVYTDNQAWHTAFKKNYIHERLSIWLV